jgi:hypothetical protein
MTNATSAVEESKLDRSESCVADIDHPVEQQSSDEFTLDVKRWAVNAFIVFHILAITCCNLPPSQLQSAGLNLFRTYLILTGTMQTWLMFSPNPVVVNTYLGATVHYADGSKRTYTFPRMAKLGTFEKYRQERWRKFIENTQPSTGQAYWPYLARYAAIVNNYTPKTNPVVSVDLMRYQRFIPQPGNPTLRYLAMKMGTYHTIAMPSPGPLLARK